MELQKGQKCKLADLTGSGQLRISVTVSLPGSEADVTCFGVDGAGKLSDDRYFIFYNQTKNRKLRTCCLTVTNRNSAAQDYQCGQCTDYDRIYKYLKDSEESLFHRFFCICTCMCNRSGTKTCLIRENSSGHTFFHTDKEASDCPRSSDRDRSCNSYNISGSDRCRECRTDCLKWRHRTI